MPLKAFMTTECVEEPVRFKVLKMIAATVGIALALPWLIGAFYWVVIRWCNYMEWVKRFFL